MSTMARYLVEAHLREGTPVAELAKRHGVHRSWIYALLARHRSEGDAGLEPRSRRPRTSPTATPAAVEERIVELRKQLAEFGVDAGAETIAWHLQREGVVSPSHATIWRVLTRRGFVTPQPHKRPKSSLIRFEAALPNEMWQSDMTHWSLADGTGVEIINYIDDHSRLCVASIAVPVATAVNTAETFLAACNQWGTPASLLTDNGCIYTAKHRNGRVMLETLLEAQGVIYKHSRPYHPQTCGKIERFHQTMKKFLAKQDPAADLPALQADIDRFVDYYNRQRPHRSLGRRIPAEVYTTKIKAHPPKPLPASHFRIRHDKVDKTGCVTLRYESQLRHIGIGRAHIGTRVVLLVADRDVRVLNLDGELLRHLQIDPSRNYQRLGST